MNYRRALELLRGIEDALALEENSVPSWTLDEVTPLVRELRQMLDEEIEDIDAGHSPSPSITDEVVTMPFTDPATGQPFELACDLCYGMDGPFYLIQDADGAVACARCKEAA